MAVPLSFRFYSAQRLVALDVAGIGSTPVADQHYISLLCVAAPVAQPIHNFVIAGFVDKLLGSDFVRHSIAGKLSYFGAAVGATGRIIEPFLQTIKTVEMAALQIGSVRYL